MIEEKDFERIARALPILRRADPGLKREFLQTAFLARIPQGKDVSPRATRSTRSRS